MKPFLTNKGAKDGSSIVIRTEDSIETNPKEVANRINNFFVNIATEIGGQTSLDQGILSKSARIIYISARPISKITPALRTLPTALEKVISLSNTLMLAPWRR